jgi:hypothetical protein
VKELYLSSRPIQALVAFVFAFAGAAILVSVTSVAHPMLLLIGLPILLSIAQISVTPALRLLGLHRYHSTMLKATLRTPQYYELHGGAVFDYLLTVGRELFGPIAARRVMVSYLEGLLEIADEVERGSLPGGMEITGTSYFFRGTTLERLGFTIRQADWGLRLNLWLHLLDVAALYSLSKGRPALPRLDRIKTAVIRGDALVRHRPDIIALLETLRPRRRREPPPRAVA